MTRPFPIAPAAGAVLLMAASAALAPLADAAGKELITAYAAVQIAWMRFAVHAVLAGGAAVATGGGLAALRPTRLQLLRGSAQFASSLCLLWALALLPLGAALIIVFTAPLLLLLARAALRCPDADGAAVALSLLCLAGIAVGYAQSPEISPAGAGLAIAAAVLLALCFGLTARTARTAGGFANSFHIAAPGAVLGLAPMIVLGRWPEGADWLVAGLIGVISALTHALIAWAMRLHRSGALPSIGYLEIPFALAYGWLLFGQAPTRAETAGAVLILLAAGGIALRLNRAAPDALVRRAGNAMARPGGAGR
ncbi:EamA family transporter [Inquilinus limosus]|uniref:EamA family transporter n=1 Tax=Inquilinus limosus TaxID=171674 RepID=UPI003F18864E